MLKLNLVTILFFCVAISLTAHSVAQTLNRVPRTIDTFNELDCPVIETTLGNISGIRQKTVLGNNSFCSYRGIRYGEPPVGKLRFKAPVPSRPWEGTYNAYEYGSACIQQSLTPMKNFKESEDCLFLNVFVPSSSVCSTTSNIAVIVLIHGGGFVQGYVSDDDFGPHLLLNKCVILVTLHYRLAVMGFLPLALPEYSGNMGLKDQQLALEWVNQHISAFGGNPKQVTLMGHSSGSASVSLHRLNSKSRNLFERTYGMSGSALNYYALSESNNKTDLIVELAKNQSIAIENSEQLIDYLQKVDTDYIVNHTSHIDNFDIISIVAWQPCVEPKTANNPFLTEDPQILLSNGVNVPSVYTYTSLEIQRVTPYVIANPDVVNRLDTNFTITLPFHGLDKDACKEEIAPIFSEIRRFYFGQATINASQLLPYVQLFSYTFVYFIHKEVALQALSKQSAQIRLLRVNMRTALTKSSSDNSSELAALAGTGHDDDTCSYFWCRQFSQTYNEIESQETLLQKSTVKASEILREILTNFAITGNPVSETASFHSFPAVNSNPLTDLPFTELLSVSTLASGTNPDHEQFKFWWGIDQKVEQIKKMSCNQK